MVMQKVQCKHWAYVGRIIWKNEFYLQSQDAMKRNQMTAPRCCQWTEKTMEQVVEFHGAGSKHSGHKDISVRVLSPAVDDIEKFLVPPPKAPRAGHDDRIGQRKMQRSFNIETHTSSKPTRSVPLVCVEQCSCRCHQRSDLRSPRNLSIYLGDLFLGCSSLPWCFSTLVPFNEQTCRRSKGSNTDLKYFLPPWLTPAIVSFTMNLSLRMVPVKVSLLYNHATRSPIFLQCSSACKKAALTRYAPFCGRERHSSTMSIHMVLVCSM